MKAGQGESVVAWTLRGASGASMGAAVGLGLLVAVACGDDRPTQGDATGASGVSAGGPQTGGPDGDDDDDDDANDSADSGDDGEDDGGVPALDVAGGMTTGAEPPDLEEGCSGIDFVFVVDNSGSMANEQENLVASFPGFVDEMESKLEELDAADFHILVTDTDSVVIAAPGPYCSFECADSDTCSAESGASVPCELYEEPGCLAICTADIEGECEAGPCKEVLGCGECNCTLGAGKTVDVEGNPCGLDDPQNFIVTPEADLHQKFACLAEVGVDGSGAELQTGAIVRSVSEEAIGAGGCNEGFLRDDAILVITLITDEEDGSDGPGSGGEPADWYADVVAAKQGNADAVVTLGLIGDAGQPGALCPDDGGPTGQFPPRIHEFVTSFPNHVVGSVCAPDYAEFFAQAVDIIQASCEDYVPPQG